VALAMMGVLLVFAAACGSNEEKGSSKRPAGSSAAQSKVRWKPWSDDLFRDGGTKPVLLDISGEWCHGCHLYDELVYSDPALADFLHENFVLVRVDPDARPDLDQRYNQGGWPTTVVLTPEGDMVAGATYAPEEFRSFLDQALATYAAGGDSLRRVLRNMREQAARGQPFLKEPGTLDAGVLDKVVTGIRPHFDEEYGGFRPIQTGMAKLAVPRAVRALVSAVEANPAHEGTAGTFVRKTLATMRTGALHDPLHGGFFRASFDRSWSHPHFEKLLETQAEMIDLYVAGALAHGSDEDLAAARSTAEFTLAVLANADSVTFANALDPDLGAGDDGSFYTWTVSEVDSLLSPEESQVAKLHFGIAPAGELESNPAANTLFVSYSIEEGASRLAIDPAVYRATLERAITRMRAYRLSGPQPRIDHTAYAGPNLEFASALLRLASAAAEPAWKTRALATVDFFTKQLLDEAGLVPHAWDGSEASGPVWLRNQVAGIEACLAGYRASSDATYLDRAKALYGATRATFRNEVSGSYWDVPATASGVARLQVKMRPLGVNVRLAESLLDLYAETGEAPYRESAEEILTSFAVSFGSAGFEALPYATAVHRLIWQLRGGSVVTS